MSPEPTPSGSVELRDYLAVFRRQLVLIIAITLLGGAAAAAYTFRRTPVYESTASVLVRAITTNAFDPSQRVDQQLNMFNQRQLAMSEPVAAFAAKTLRTTATPAELLEHVKVDVPANSQILRIRYRDTVPLTAQKGADAFARAYLAFREADARAQAKASQTTIQKDVTRLNKQVAEAEKVISNPSSDASDRQAATARIQSLNTRLQPLNVQLNGFLSLDFTPGTVIAAADLPATSTSPNNRLDIGIGLLVGLFLGVVLAFVRDRTDDRLRGREDLAERLDRPVLATIPPLSKRVRQEGTLRWKRRSRNSLVTLEQPNSPAAESYRTLRTRMARLASQLDINSVMVVSAGVGGARAPPRPTSRWSWPRPARTCCWSPPTCAGHGSTSSSGLQNKSGLSNLLTDGTPPNKRKGPVADGKQMASELWSVAPNLWVVLSGPLPPRPRR